MTKAGKASLVKSSSARTNAPGTGIVRQERLVSATASPGGMERTALAATPA